MKKKISRTVPESQLFKNYGFCTEYKYYFVSLHQLKQNNMRSNNKWQRLAELLLFVTLAVNNASAQEPMDNSLSRHNFFYAGQSKQRRMFIVKDGLVS